MKGVKWGTLEIPTEEFHVNYREQVAPPLRTSAFTRSDRDIRSYVIDSLHVGLGVKRETETVEGRLRYTDSDGLWAQQPGELTLPPKTNSHAAVFTTASLGDYVSFTRWNNVNYYGVGPELLKDGEGAGGSPDVVHTFTNNILWIGVIHANSTEYFAVLTDGTTDDCVVTTDPEAASITWSTWITLGANEYFDFAHDVRNLGSGFTVLHGTFDGVTGWWYLDSSSALNTDPSKLVDAATKSIIGDIANATDSERSPAVGSAVDVVDGQFWVDPENILASEGNDATFLFSTATNPNYTPLLYGIFNGQFDTLPRGAYVTEITLTVECAETNASLNAYLMAKMWWSGAVQTFELINDTEVGTSDADRTLTFVPVDTTISDIRDLAAAVRFLKLSALTGEGVSVDHVAVTIKYTVPGTQIKGTAGARYIGEDPIVENRIWYILDEGIHYIDFEYDADCDRPVGTKNHKLMPWPYINTACFTNNYIYVIGGLVGNYTRALARISLYNGAVEEMNWQREQGFNSDIVLVNVRPGGGDDVVLDTYVFVFLASTDIVSQPMLYSDKYNSFNFIGTKETHDGAPMPISYGHSTIAPDTGERHTLYYDGDIDRQYQPESFQTAFAVNNGGTVDRESDVELTITLPEIPIAGPIEANNMLLRARIGSHDISSGAIVKLYYSTNGGTSFTTWGTFSAFNQVLELTPPVSVSSVVIKIGLDHDSAGSGVDVLQALPIIIEVVSKFPPLREIRVTIDPSSGEFKKKYPKGITNLWTQMAALQESSGPAQLLYIGDQSFYATWENFNVATKPGASVGAKDLPINTVDGNVLVFHEMP